MDHLPVEALEERADYVAERLALLSDPKRLLILCQLSQGEMSVGALQARLQIGQSALSQHPAKLREAGMVATRREAQTIYYCLGGSETEMATARYDALCRT